MSDSRPRLWIVCPTYLDVESFLRVRSTALEALSRLEGETFGEIRVVAIDDTGGHDPQIERLRTLEQVTVVEPPFNLGHQRALVFALRSLASSIATHDYVVTMDSDGEDRPEDLPALLSPLLTDSVDVRKVAVAQRTQRSETPTFRVLYFFFRVLFRTLTGRVIRSGNFAAYRGWLVHDVLFHPHFDFCYSSSFISLNLTLTFVPLARGQRYAGRSRMGLARLLTHGVSMLMPFTERIAIRALVAGASTVALTSLAMAAFAVSAVAFDHSPPRSVWLAVLLLDLFSLAALGNFFVLFAAFVQARGSLLRGIEMEHDGSS